MEARADDNQSSYKVIAFQGSQLPGQYINLLFSKWLRSLRFGNDYFKLIHSDSYYEVYHRYILSLLAKPETVVRLAVLSDDSDVVLGFSVARGPVLDYVHVQRDFRRTGIARSLVPGPILAITHLTKTAMSIWQNKLPDAVFNPFL